MKLYLDLNALACLLLFLMIKVRSSSAPCQEELENMFVKGPYHVIRVCLLSQSAPEKHNPE